LPARQSTRPKEISGGFRTAGDVIISVPRVADTALLHFKTMIYFAQFVVIPGVKMGSKCGYP